MPSIVTGARDTTNTLQARFKLDVADDIRMLEDDASQLYKLLSTLPKKQAIAKQIHWFTDEVIPRADMVNGAVLAGAASITVDNGGYWTINDILQHPPSGFTARVTNVVGNVLTVTNPWGPTASAAIADNAQVLNLGPAYSEGATLQTPHTTVEVDNTNYQQIFRHNVKMTGTDIAIGEVGGQYAGSDWDDQREKMLLEHMRDMNQSIFWGEAQQVGLVRSLGGINSYIPAGQRDSTAALTRAAFESFLESKGFRYGAMNKVLVCSYRVASIINAYALEQTGGPVIRTSSGDTAFGIHLERYKSFHGDLTFMPDRAIGGDDVLEHSKYAFLLDMAEVYLKPLRDTKLYVEVQTPDEDAQMDTYLTETSVEWGNPRDHAALTGVTS